MMRCAQLLIAIITLCLVPYCSLSVNQKASVSGCQRKSAAERVATRALLLALEPLFTSRTHAKVCNRFINRRGSRINARSEGDGHLSCCRASSCRCPLASRSAAKWRENFFSLSWNLPQGCPCFSVDIEIQAALKKVADAVRCNSFVHFNLLRWCLPPRRSHSSSGHVLSADDVVKPRQIVVCTGLGHRKRCEV